jgi:DNA-binding NarL/FixJ family response regulator
MYKATAISDNTFTRAGFEKLVSTCQDLKLEACAPYSSAVAETCVREGHDLVIVDLGSLDQPMKVLRTLRKSSETLRIIAVCSGKSIDVAVEALDSGASGLLTNDSDLSDLTTAARRVMGGDNYVHPDMSLAIFAALRGAEAKRREAERLRLTARETQVVRHLMQGMTNRQISNKLKISEKTVKHYVGTLMEKFSASNRLEVVLEAQRLEI